MLISYLQTPTHAHKLTPAHTHTHTGPLFTMDDPRGNQKVVELTSPRFSMAVLSI